MPSARLLGLALVGATGLVLVAPAAAFAAPNSHSAGHGPAVAHAGKPAHLGKPAVDPPVSTDPGDKPDGDKPAADESARPDAGNDNAGDDKAVGHKPVGHGPVNHMAGSKFASHALAAATASVTRVAAFEQASTVLGAPDRIAMAAFNARALSALSANVTAAGSATRPQDVAGLLQTGRRTAHAVKLVENVVTGSARDAAVIGQLTSAAAALRTHEAGLPAGTDTRSVVSPLAQTVHSAGSREDRPVDRHSGRAGRPCLACRNGPANRSPPDRSCAGGGRRRFVDRCRRLDCCPDRAGGPDHASRRLTTSRRLRVATEQQVSVGPGAASIAALTDRELPQVEKNAWSAPTASAISVSAAFRKPPEDERSSRPALASTSERYGASPSTSRVRGSAPRPCDNRVG